MSWKSSWQRRFSSASAHEDLLSTPKVRIRTWSDSVAETATPEEIADHESELIQQRRNSNAANSGHHVTNFLASQTLGLCFLAVPRSTAIKSHESANHPAAEAGLTVTLQQETWDLDENAATDTEIERRRVLLPLRRASDLTHRQFLTPPSKPERRFSSGARLDVPTMATLSARRAKTSLLSASLKNSLASSSTSKLDENSTGLRSSLDEPIIVTPPSPHRKKSSTTSAVITNNNKESDVGTESRNYQLKKFSQSTPALPQLHYDLVNNLGRSKSRQKKFLRLFPNVSRDERVLNHYSCALVGDLLLQGHLYITYNYFAFHSNVFGYITKLLIPMGDVKKITKEKTAKIIPNAIGVATVDGKKIFGSLMARDVAYRLACSVWRKYHYPNGGDFVDSIDGERENEGSSQNGEHSSNESFSQHSAEGLIMSLSRPAPGDSAHVTSATEGCTSSEMDEDDSAIERSYSPTPERDDEVADIRRTTIQAGLSTLNLLSSAVASSKRILFSSRSRTSLVSPNDGGVDEIDGGGHHTTDESYYEPENAKDDYPNSCNQEQRNSFNYSALPMKSISFILLILCFSAGLLWYRMYLLHSHLELRLLSEETARKMSSSVKSLYSPQMQELVDSLHFILTSRASNNEERSGK